MQPPRIWGSENFDSDGLLVVIVNDRLQNLIWGHQRQLSNVTLSSGESHVVCPCRLAASVMSRNGIWAEVHWHQMTCVPVGGCDSGRFINATRVLGCGCIARISPLPGGSLHEIQLPYAPTTHLCQPIQQPVLSHQIRDRCYGG